jgi:hypothetical protein
MYVWRPDLIDKKKGARPWTFDKLRFTLLPTCPLGIAGSWWICLPQLACTRCTGRGCMCIARQVCVCQGTEYPPAAADRSPPARRSHGRTSARNETPPLTPPEEACAQQLPIANGSGVICCEWGPGRGGNVTCPARAVGYVLPVPARRGLRSAHCAAVWCFTCLVIDRWNCWRQVS